MGSAFGLQPEAAYFEGWDRGGVAEDHCGGDRGCQDARPKAHGRHVCGQSGANAFLVRDLLRHKNLAMTSRYVNRADSPVRTLSDQVGERIAAAMAGRPAAEVVPLKTTRA
jgi:hypothetical protein